MLCEANPVEDGSGLTLRLLFFSANEPQSNITLLRIFMPLYGFLPFAVKVGGMRVVQHRATNADKTSGDSPEDTTGLAVKAH